MRLRVIAMLCGVVGFLPLAVQAQQSRATLFCGSIGVGIGPMTAAIADSLGMTERYGGVFRRPRPGGPAAKAGIAAYDVLTAVNGAPLANWRNFATMIAAMAPGTVVDLTTYRDRQLIDVRVGLGWRRCTNGPGKRGDRAL
jgi:serine protease Do